MQHIGLRLRALFISIAIFAGIPACEQATTITKSHAQERPDRPDDRKATDFEVLSDKVTQVAKQTKNALVFISVVKTVSSGPVLPFDPFEFFFGQPRNGIPQPPQGRKQEGLGSGFFIDAARRYVVTNNHVVEEAEEIEVKLANGNTYSAEIVGRDKYTDLAVIEVAADEADLKNVHNLAFERSGTIEVGDFVLAMGAPFGLESSVSFGIISAIGRGSLGIAELGDFIQTDAAINPGNSGGPLLNLQGKVIGVNTAIYSTSGAYNGIGFAVPADIAKHVTDKLISEGKIERGYLGVSLQPLDENLRESLNLPQSAEGALVSQVEPNSPAEQAGLKAGDVVSQVEGKIIGNPGDLANEVGFKQPGTEVELKIFRDGKPRTLSATLAAFPEAETAVTRASDSQGLGLSLQMLTEDLRQKFNITSKAGVIISEVVPDSPAAEKGIQAGDVIISVNRKAVRAPEEVIAAAEEENVLLLRLERQGQQFFVALETRSQAQSE